MYKGKPKIWEKGARSEAEGRVRVILGLTDAVEMAKSKRRRGQIPAAFHS
jgi:hypothetical protein